MSEDEIRKFMIQIFDRIEAFDMVTDGDVILAGLLGRMRATSEAGQSMTLNETELRLLGGIGALFVVQRKLQKAMKANAQHQGGIPRPKAV